LIDYTCNVKNVLICYVYFVHHVHCRRHCVSHYDKGKLPQSFGKWDYPWAPMDTETPFAMELVPLEISNIAFDDVKNTFYSSMDDITFGISRIYHVQNLNLWNSFQT